MLSRIFLQTLIRSLTFSNRNTVVHNCFAVELKTRYLPGRSVSRVLQSELLKGIKKRFQIATLDRELVVAIHGGFSDSNQKFSATAPQHAVSSQRLYAKIDIITSFDAKHVLFYMLIKHHIFCKIIQSLHSRKTFKSIGIFFTYDYDNQFKYEHYI